MLISALISINKQRADLMIHKIIFLSFLSILAQKYLIAATPYFAEIADAASWDAGRAERLESLQAKVDLQTTVDGFELDMPIALAEENFSKIMRGGEKVVDREAIQSLLNFSQKGGCIHWVKDSFDLESEKPFVASFLLHSKTDLLIPICHAGQNRSQVVKVVLADAHPDISVLAPHGAFSGFDPHSAYRDLTEDNFFGYIHSTFRTEVDSSDNLMNLAFTKALGVSKQERIGSVAYKVLGQKPLNLLPGTSLRQLAINRSEMRCFMSEYFWKKAALLRDGKRRKIFVCFGDSSTVVAKRLVESVQVHLDALIEEQFSEGTAKGKEEMKKMQLQSIFKKIHIIVVPWIDPITNIASKAELKRQGLEETPENKMFLTEKCYKSMYHQYSKLFYAVD